MKASRASDGSPTRASTDLLAPEDWVPLDRRWLGLDRATIPYALAVLGMAFLLAVVLPTINEAVPNPNTVQTGDTLRFSAGVTVQPPIGWTIESGARASEPPPGGWPGKAKVVGGATVVNLKVASYTGELKGLLSVLKDQTDALNGEAGFHVAGAPARFTTAQGVPGLLSRFESATTIGVLAVAIRDGIGVEITATGTQTLGRDSVSDVAGILDSISFGGTAR